MCYVENSFQIDIDGTEIQSKRRKCSKKNVFHLKNGKLTYRNLLQSNQRLICLHRHQHYSPIHRFQRFRAFSSIHLWFLTNHSNPIVKWTHLHELFLIPAAVLMSVKLHRLLHLILINVHIHLFQFLWSNIFFLQNYGETKLKIFLSLFTLTSSSNHNCFAFKIIFVHFEKRIKTLTQLRYYTMTMLRLLLQENEWQQIGDYLALYYHWFVCIIYQQFCCSDTLIYYRIIDSSEWDSKEITFWESFLQWNCSKSPYFYMESTLKITILKVVINCLKNTQTLHFIVVTANKQ